MPVDVTARPGPRRRVWLGYGVAAVGLAGVYFAAPGHHLALWTPLGLSSVLAIVVGIRLSRPAPVLAWYLLAAGGLCFIAGDTMYTVLTEVLHQDNPFPSVADVAYLLAYPLWATGLWSLIRSRSTARDHASLLDALIITTGLGLLSWLYLVLPNFQADGLTALQHIVSVAYPVGDVLVLALLARLIAAGGLRLPSVLFLIVGAIGLLAADVGYGLAQLGGSWAVGGPVDVGWAVFYIAFGIAALHPSSTLVGAPVERRSAHVGTARIVLLASVSLVAPVVLLYEAMNGGVRNGVSIGLCSAALYLLVIARLAGIVADHRRSVERERVLRSLGESLVSARSVADVFAACLGAAAVLSRPSFDWRCAVYLARPDGVERVAASHPVDSATADASLWDPDRPAGYVAERRTVSVTPLRDDGLLIGMLVVRSSTAISAEEHGALSTLASQVALALQSATLAESLRRQQSESHFRALIQNASDLILVVDDGGLVNYATPSFGRAIARPPAEVTGTELALLLHPGDRADLESSLDWGRRRSAAPLPMALWRLREADGAYLSFEVLFTNLLDDESVGGMVLTMHDVSERRVLEEQLKHQAFHDGLTGLPNRSLFRVQAARALDEAQRTGSMLALLVLDLDDFKLVNDTRGHGAGDELLQEVAHRIRAGLGPSDSAARFGGDEFAVVAVAVESVTAAQATAESVIESLSRPFTVNGEPLYVRASAGLVVAAGVVALELPELLRRADLALMAAKERGKGQIVLYHDDLHARMLDRLARVADLQRGVRAGEFFLQYQPIVELGTGRIIGAEALMRWLHPEHGLVSPLSFIELAEDTGVIVELGLWALDAACAQARRWADGSHDAIRVAVNVSGRQLQEATFVSDVRAALERYDLPPALLVIEITESILVRDGSGNPERIQELRDLGLRIAIDDFGTGYSSLGYLQRFPVDILKVDKAFVDGLGKNEDYDTAIARTIVSLAQALHIEVVAEGIEDVAQRDELVSLGCARGQGFLFSRPVAPERLSILLSAGTPLGASVPAPFGDLHSTFVHGIGAGRRQLNGEP